MTATEPMLSPTELRVAHERFEAAMDQVVQQLRSAFAESGMTLAELLKLSGLELHVSTLRRKLIGDGRKNRRGLVRLSPEEAEALAAALGKALIAKGEKLMPVARSA